MTDKRSVKPLGHKGYGSIPHLSTSRMGPAEHRISPGQERIVTIATRDKHDHITIQQKLDGSNCSVAKVNGEILALGRAGYLATTSSFEQHHFFAHWVRAREQIFEEMLIEGERIIGEWLAQAHGTRYDPTHPSFRPFVAFDVMRGTTRKLTDHVYDIVMRHGRGEIGLPQVVATVPLPPDEAIKLCSPDSHGAIDPIEGVVYRCERKGQVQFLAKWVRSDKIDGEFLPEVSGKEAVWHWRTS